MQPSLAQIATALISLSLIAVFAVIFDGQDVDDSSAPHEAKLRRPAPRQGDPTDRAPVIVTERGRAIPEVEALRYKRGEVVRFVVASDRRDTVHVRGPYGIKAPVSPSQPARLEFQARQAGSFEVELDSIENQIASVSVKP